MYVYPTKDPKTGEIQSLMHPPAPRPWHHLSDLLHDIGRTQAIESYNESYLSIHREDVLKRIQSGDPSWEEMVPELVAGIIKSKRLFGWEQPAQLVA